MTIQNSGEVAAEDVVVFVGLPESADIAGAEASAGTPRTRRRTAARGLIQWSLSRLGPRAREKLVLRLVPRQSRSFDLAVRLGMQSGDVEATIEVQEAKLALRLARPADGP